MYRAKTRGRNRCVGIMAGEGIKEQASARDILEPGLDQALGLGLVRLVE